MPDLADVPHQRTLPDPLVLQLAEASRAGFVPSRSSHRSGSSLGVVRWWLTRAARDEVGVHGVSEQM